MLVAGSSFENEFGLVKALAADRYMTDFVASCWLKITSPRLVRSNGIEGTLVAG